MDVAFIALIFFEEDKDKGNAQMLSPDVLCMNHIICSGRHRKDFSLWSVGLGAVMFLSVCSPVKERFQVIFIS